MSNANIPKGHNVSHVVIRIYDTLTKIEISKLRKKTIGHGNMKACVDAIGITRQTIYKAMLGGKLYKETADKIREFLNPESVGNDQSGTQETNG